MSFNPDSDSKKITNESWRPRFYGLLQEGRKFRVSLKAVRISIVILALGIFAFQMYSALKPSFRRSADVMFTPPQLRSEITSSYVPPIMNETRAEEIEKERLKEIASRGKVQMAPIEKIKPISLGRLSGIPAGSEVMAELKSGGSNGMVKVALLENLTAQGETLLPKETILLGQGTSSDERLYIAFRRAILPDKTTTRVNALGYDEKDRMIGLKGKKVSDYAFRLAASAGLIFLGGMADGMRNDNSYSPFETRRPTTRDAALNGVSTATSDMSRDVIQGMKNQQERVEVAHSTHLVIIFGDANEKDQ